MFRLWTSAVASARVVERWNAALIQKKNPDTEEEADAYNKTLFADPAQKVLQFGFWRSGTWGYLDLDRGLWIVMVERMRAGLMSGEEKVRK